MGLKCDKKYLWIKEVVPSLHLHELALLLRVLLLLLLFADSFLVKELGRVVGIIVAADVVQSSDVESDKVLKETSRDRKCSISIIVSY